VLDFSAGRLGETQERWLQTKLSEAKTAGVPAIVMGDASLSFVLPDAVPDDPPPAQVEAADVAAVSRILVEGEASAYLFDYPGVNVQAQVRYGAKYIPAFGTGTLGYSSPSGEFQTDSLGSSGFLLLSVDTTPRKSTPPDFAPYEVTARVEPNIGELALQATSGVLLRRSEVGLFEGLARIPSSGRAIAVAASGRISMLGPQAYEPIPFDCQGANCADQIPTDFAFTSSNPEVGDFVAHEAASANPLQVAVGANGLALPDSHSGLFCAYNEGTTVVSLTTGGLTYSEPVTVQGGSVEYPCGTVPLKNPPPAKAPVRSSFAAPTLAPAANPPQIAPRIQLIVPPPAPAHHPAARPPVPLAVVPGALPALFPLRPVVPPPAPNPARPTPPSGTAPVSQTVGVAEQEQEHESAAEVAHHMALLDHEQRAPAYRHALLGEARPILVSSAGARAHADSTLPVSGADEGPLPAWPAALIAVALASALGVRRRAGSERLARVRLSDPN
jgi:hypothetical protein